MGKMKEERASRLLAWLVAILVGAELLLVLLSWLLSATTDADGVRSLLSAEGIRFFCGGFVEAMLMPPLVWLLLLAMAWGCLRASGLADAMAGRTAMRRQALWLALGVLTVYLLVIALLAVAPHAVLLSATGRLWPSPFSQALVPVLAFGTIVVAAAYGLSVRRFANIADVCQALSAGIAAAAPLFLLYVLAMQLYASLRFVFG